ncbi:MAG: hypothetical protein Q4F97_06640 [Bacteroidales bacterium]|nr:hypothetical protein [Bacteroidales bacterium]
MELAYYYLSELCNSLVIKYEHIRAEDENISIIDKHLLSGYVSLVFNFSGNASIHK